MTLRAPCSALLPALDGCGIPPAEVDQRAEAFVALALHAFPRPRGQIVEDVVTDA